ncbi:MAG: PAS domain S-box protein [Desulfobacula sp.]|nr:PAS domain S-box protein [Desulfobacula sp.]
MHKLKNSWLKIIFSITVFWLFSILATADNEGLNPPTEITQLNLELTHIEKDWLKNHKSIRIGGPRSFPPFHYYEKEGDLKGISADYIITIMDQLGVKVIVKQNLPWPEVLEQAKTGKIDLIPCIAKTHERENFLSFSAPYLSFPLVIITRNDSSFIGGIEDLYDKKLAIIKKVSTNEWLKRDGVKFLPHYVDSPLMGLKSVSLGKADARIENLATATYLIQKHGLTNLKVAAPTPYGNYDLHMAVGRNLPELLSIINKALYTIPPEKHMQFRNKWLSVRFEYGINKTDVIKWVLGIAGIAVLFVSSVLIWNRRLNKEVIKRQKSEVSLKKSEDRFRQIYNNIVDVYFESSLDGILLEISPSIENITHYRREELIGKSLYDIYINPEDRDKFIEIITNKGIVRDYEITLNSKAGNQHTYSMNIELIKDDKNNPIKLVGIFRDITERKHADEILRESEKKFRVAFQTSPNAITITNVEDGTYIDINDGFTKMLGYSQEDVIGKSSIMLDIWNDSKDRERLVSGLKKYGIVESLEADFKGKEGQIRTGLMSAHVLNIQNQNIVLAVTQDLTQIKQAEKEKIKAQQIAGEQKKLALVGQVAGKMAHDFNNILGIIMGNTELSLMDCKEESTKKTLELIFEQTMRGKNLTRNLVAFAKDQEPKQEFFRISEKIDLVLSLLKKDLEGIELIKEDKAGVPDLLADQGMIEHAFVNLIQNSIHAVSLAEHPRIISRIYSLDDNIYIEIEDNGCGIPKKYLENIFEPSFTLKGSNDTTGSYGREIQGTGYGMPNVKKYIEQHKGSILVDSEFGSGTKFTISLPVIKKELTRQEKAEIQKLNLYFDKYILLVEDEPAISGVLYKILSQEPCGHKVDIAHDGQVAVDLFKRNEYDLISLDYALPGGINGMDVYDHIRKTNKTIPILFISGNIEFLESIKNLKQKDGNIEHLSKPCQNKDYVKSINELFERNLASKE